MIEGRARPRGRAGGLVTGSWTRTIAVLAVLIALAAILSGLAYSGRFGDLRYANIPLVHPWPAQGYTFNDLDPGNRTDVISAAEAAKVRSDLLADGKVEIDAYAHGLTDPLSQADTGRALARAAQGVIANNHAGFYEMAGSQLDSVVVGRLADPNDSSIQWCVVERGVSNLAFVAQATGATVRSESFKFEGRFWLIKVGDRYLIADVEIRRLS